MSKKDYDIKYANENLKRVALNLNKVTDKDIISYLESKSNVQGFIKSLVRKEMNNMNLKDLIKMTDPNEKEIIVLDNENRKLETSISGLDPYYLDMPIMNRWENEDLLYVTVASPYFKEIENLNIINESSLEELERRYGLDFGEYILNVKEEKKKELARSYKGFDLKYQYNIWLLDQYEMYEDEKTA